MLKKISQKRSQSERIQLEKSKYPTRHSLKNVYAKNVSGGRKEGVRDTVDLGLFIVML